jgi:hypothetical protein
MKLPYIAALVAAGAISLGGAAFATGSLLSGSPAPVAPEVTAQAQAAPMPVRPRHTLADMQELQDGISYDHAARTLGTLGHAETWQAAGLPGMKNTAGMAVYSWPNPDGSRVVLVFQHDRLIHKRHEGLR